MRAIVSALVGFLVLNGLLWLGQEIYHREGMAQAERLEQTLGALEVEIAEQEAWLAARQAASDDIDALGAHVDKALQYYATEVEYLAALELFNTRVGEWNAALPELEQAFAQYDSTITRYNGMVEDYNAIASKAYAQWWLLPIPLGRRASRTVR